ncbi:uncharacterized protein LOC132003690 [Mustela nigripes]|uniref:uncharacterized protein LOC132003690 n=1 Tax=Mustela nigripes TaxID=77151 RepID=UPI0028150261|nr:uncharacterized protein LOC132003690 [Mustela nigripes]
MFSVKNAISKNASGCSHRAPPTCCRTSICRPPSPGLRPPQLPPASSRRQAWILPQPANTLRWFPFYKNQASNSCFQSFLLSFNTNLLDKVVNNSASMTQALAHSLPVTTGLWYHRSGDAAPAVLITHVSVLRPARGCIEFHRMDVPPSVHPAEAVLNYNRRGTPSIFQDRRDRMELFPCGVWNSVERENKVRNKDKSSDTKDTL